MADWHHVYIPYCTGDLHAGNNPSARVKGVVKEQNFVGYKNINIALQHLLSHAKGINEILLAGASAGGFGVLYNYSQVANAFPGKKLLH